MAGIGILLMILGIFTMIFSYQKMVRSQQVIQTIDGSAAAMCSFMYFLGIFILFAGISLGFVGMIWQNINPLNILEVIKL